jgi:hypothetical protein
VNIEKGALTPDEFIPLYERALASQRWLFVPDDSCVTFSDGTVRAYYRHETVIRARAGWLFDLL